MIQDLVRKLKTFSKNEKIHIFYLFKRHHVEYTQNSNGIFINLQHVDKNILQKIIDCANLIEEKRDLILELDTKRDMYIEYYKNMMNVKISEIEHNKQCEINEMLRTEEEDFTVVKFAAIDNYNEEDDNDVTSLEYFKNYKVYKDKSYHKDSVYFRLSQKIHSISKNSKSTNNYNYRCKPSGSSDLSDLSADISDLSSDLFEEPLIDDTIGTTIF